MTPLLATVFAASLLGSMHCAGMCGGFVALYSATPSCGGAGRGGWKAHLAYNGGRLSSYLLVGFLAGLLGGLLDAAGDLAGLQRTAAIAAGVAMLLWGSIALARAAGLRLGRWSRRFPGTQRLQALLGRAMSAVGRWPPTRHALAIGVLTPLLPCGWLYLFAITAAGAGSAPAGAAVMLAFWAGTVPALAGLGLGLNTIFGAGLRRRIPQLSGLALVVVGSLTLLQRGQALAATPRPVLEGQAATARIASADATAMPCCDEGAP